MKFKEFLKESFDIIKAARSRRFSDSGEATSCLEQVNTILNSAALEDWAKATDDNFSTNSLRDLKKVKKAYSDFLDTMYSAGE